MDLHGVIPYLATPTDSTGAVNHAALTALCERLIAAGVHGLCPLGSTGEFAYLTPAQRADVIACTVAAARGRVPVIAGVADTATSGAIAQALAAQEAGADGLLVVMEAYFPISQDGVAGYFTAVADATGLPVTIYTNPNFQRSDLELGTILRLSEHPRVRYLKDASTNTGRLLSVIDRAEGRIGVFAASSHITASVMLIGGLGWMSGPACLIPAQSVRLYDLCRAGDWNAAMALQRDLWRVNEVFARYNLAAAVKAGLRLQGLDCGDPLPPQAALSPDAVADIAGALRRAGALPGG